MERPEPQPLPRRVRRALRALKRTLFELRRLLRKERRAAASPVTYLFLLFSGLTLLPAFPILLGPLLICLGIFYSVLSARDANDLVFTALLPVERSAAVLGKYGFACCVELLAFALMCALTALRMTALRDAPLYAGNAMLAANPLFLGLALLIFAAFNLLFLGGFFRTARGVAKPLARFLPAAAALIVLGEALCHIPGLAVLNRVSGPYLWIQYLILAVCAALYIFATHRSCRRAVTAFEKLDL